MIPAATHPSLLRASRLGRLARSILAAIVVLAAMVTRTEAAEATFLPGVDGLQVWRRTVATIAAEWPVARVVEPDFFAVPPRAGLIESAWVDPAAEPTAAWPPRRQRVVVRVMPGADGAATGGDGVELVGGWQADPESDDVQMRLVAQLAPAAPQVQSLPPLDREEFLAPPPAELPWSRSRFPRLSRAGHKIVEDYRNFYDCDGLVSTAAAFGAGAIMANTGFDDTMQNAWQQGVEPTGLGTFFSGCKDIGEGRYALPIFGVAAATGAIFEGNPVGDVVGEWGSRSLRMFVVGGPPVYVLQMATGAGRPSEDRGSSWQFWNDNNGVSGHAFVGAIPFLAAADMVESPLLKGTLYVCSTFVGFSRMTDNAHYPSQVFLGWYLAWASSRAVSMTETHFAGMEIRVVPRPMADLGGVAVEGRW